jgi:hypothetical protein
VTESYTDPLDNSHEKDYNKHLETTDPSTNREFEDLPDENDEIED